MVLMVCPQKTINKQMINQRFLEYGIVDYLSVQSDVTFHGFLLYQYGKSSGIEGAGALSLILEIISFGLSGLVEFCFTTYLMFSWSLPNAPKGLPSSKITLRSIAASFISSNTALAGGSTGGSAITV